MFIQYDVCFHLHNQQRNVRTKGYSFKMDSNNLETPLIKNDSTEDSKYQTLTGNSTGHSYDESKKHGPESKPQSHMYQQLVAIVFQVIALFGMSLSGAASQILAGAIPEFELNAWRFGLLILIFIPVNMARKCDFKVPMAKIPLLVVNIIVMNAVNILMFTMYIYLPVGLADGLGNVIVIVGNALLSICIKSERKCVLYVAAVISIIGIVLMIQPPVMFSGAKLPPPPTVNWTSPCLLHGDIFRNVTSETDDTGLNGMTLGYILVFSMGILNLIKYHILSRLVATVSPFNFAFWNALVGTVTSLILMGIFETPTLRLSGFCILMLVVNCVGNAMMTSCSPWSLQYISATLVAMINACKMPIMMLYQYTFLRNIKPGLQNWVEILGAVICFLGMIGGPLLDIVSSRKLMRPKTDA